MPYDPIVNDHYGDILWKLDRKIEAVYYWNSVLKFKDFINHKVAYSLCRNCGHLNVLREPAGGGAGPPRPHLTAPQARRARLSGPRATERLCPSCGPESCRARCPQPFSRASRRSYGSCQTLEHTAPKPREPLTPARALAPPGAHRGEGWCK